MTSFLEAKGVPGMAERTLVRPPRSQLGPVDAALRAQLIAASPMGQKYNTLIDRDSAYERLRARSDKAAQDAAAQEAADARKAEEEKEYSRARRYDGGADAKPAARAPSRRSDSMGEAFAKSFVRQLGTRTGQAVVRGILGSIFGKR